MQKESDPRPQGGGTEEQTAPVDGRGFFLPVHGIRVLKRRFFGASQPENSNKKPPWLLGGLKNYPGVFLPNGCIVSALVDDRAQVSSCLRDYNVVAPLKSTYP